MRIMDGQVKIIAGGGLPSIQEDGDGQQKCLWQQAFFGLAANDGAAAKVGNADLIKAVQTLNRGRIIHGAEILVGGRDTARRAIF